MTENKLKYDFFICSSGKDSAIIEQVLNQLAGFNVFYPPLEMSKKSGEMYFDALADALSNSRHFIMIISPDSTKSKWVKIEYQTFFNNFYSIENNRMIFLLQGKDFDINDVPLFFRNFQISEDIKQIIASVKPQHEIYTVNETINEPELIKLKKKSVPRKRNKFLKVLAYFLIIVVLLAGGYILFDHYKEPVLSFLKLNYHKITSRIKDSEDRKSAERSMDENAEIMEPEDNQSVSIGIEERAMMPDPGKNVLESIVKPEPGQFIPENYMSNPVIISDAQPDIQLKDYIASLNNAKVINYPNGNRFEGELKDGKLHGRGMLFFAVRTLISKNDPLERYADAGFYLIGEWFEGELYMGQLYNKRGEMTERIIIGRK